MAPPEKSQKGINVEVTSVQPFPKANKASAEGVATRGTMKWLRPLEGDKLTLASQSCRNCHATNRTHPHGDAAVP